MDAAVLAQQKYIFLRKYTSKKYDTVSIALESAIKSAVKRNPTYSDTITGVQKKEVVLFWQNELIHLGKKYIICKQTEDAFVEDVLVLKKALNGRFREHLSNKESRGVRISHCQKSLAVFLKYRWCQGELPFEPPVCPVDRFVLNHIGKNNISWTKMDDEEIYRDIIKVISEAVKNNICCKSPSEWELCMFNTINN